MRLISFERDFFLTFLLFIGGCFSFQPPMPVEITTPATVSRERLVKENEMELEFNLINGNDIYYSLRTGQGPRATVKVNSDDTGQVIKEAIELSRAANKTLVVFVKTSTETDPALFKLVTKSLSEKQITKYNLITHPNRNGH
jgi:hypothetical protein